MIGLDRTRNMFLPYKIRTEKHECIGGPRDITTRQALSRWCTAAPGCNWHRLRWREEGWRWRQRLDRIVAVFWLDKRPRSHIGRKHEWFLGRARETDTIHSRFGWVQAYRGWVWAQERSEWGLPVSITEERLLQLKAWAEKREVGMMTEKPAVGKRLIFISGGDSKFEWRTLATALAIQSLSLTPVPRHRHKRTYLDRRTTADVDGNDRVGSSPLCRIYVGRRPGFLIEALAYVQIWEAVSLFSCIIILLWHRGYTYRLITWNVSLRYLSGLLISPPSSFWTIIGKSYFHLLDWCSCSSN